MNTKLKVAAGVVAGLVAGTTLMGAAFAAPRLASAPAAYGYSVLRSFETSGAFGTPTYQKMFDFMNQYRSMPVGFDVARLHAGVTTGTLAPPRVSRSTGAARASAPTPAGTTGPQTRYRTMGGSAGPGTGMMGGLY